MRRHRDRGTFAGLQRCDKDNAVYIIDLAIAIITIGIVGGLTITFVVHQCTEVEIVDRQKLIATVRKLLTRPRLADMVIPDLARWGDWSCLDSLVAMFKDPTANPTWIRVPIFRYLMECPLPQAKVHLEELKQLDPDAYQRAVFLSKMDEGLDEEDFGDEGDEEWDESGGE